MSAILVQRRVPPRGIPAPVSLRAFASAAGAEGALCLRVVDADESRALNHRFRGKNRPTNVLSFPAASPLVEEPELGDIVLCAPVIAAEAAEQGKSPRAHWAHMVVHGVLHLRGHDHIDDDEARVMEAAERRILAGLGFADPY
ncbi:rRNA maturation RNase YbeY [Algiphilus aromaticivorans]|uniref:rRNA maturation RNase YbeY n=1 Tax=Algiphilus aromaticivorans TaxID=382454 RepID=UPI0005C1F071|nr:rRNA maturation RNase YbeY [Algiphilus aromaticivorans]